MRREKNKINLKFILGKVFLLLFCIIFISTYKSIFGDENSLVGVMLLTGLLIFLSCDFGYEARYAAMVIPIGFICIGIFAKLSNINPFIGILINIAVMQGIFMISRGDKSNSVYLPFMMGYLMFKGEDVYGAMFAKRIVSLAIIGGIIGLIYFLINKKKEYTTPYREMLQNFSNSKSYKRWKIVLTVTLVLSIFLGDIFKLEKEMWLNLAVLSLIPPVKEWSKERTLHRVPGTVFGSMLSIVIFGCLIPIDYHPIAMMVGGFCSMFMTRYILKTVFNSFSALGAATAIMPIHKAVTMRISFNIIALILAIISIFVFETIFKNRDKKYKIKYQEISSESLYV